jgi:hypothetical protein
MPNTPSHGQYTHTAVARDAYDAALRKKGRIMYKDVSSTDPKIAHGKDEKGW